MPTSFRKKLLKGVKYGAKAGVNGAKTFTRRVRGLVPAPPAYDEPLTVSSLTGPTPPSQPPQGYDIAGGSFMGGGGYKPPSTAKAAGSVMTNPTVMTIPTEASPDDVFHGVDSSPAYPDPNPPLPPAVSPTDRGW